MNFMDGDGYMEIIFYILLAIAGIAVNAYRNFNKQKEEKQRKESRSFDFPDIEQEPIFTYEEETEEDIRYDEPVQPWQMAPEPAPEIIQAEEKAGEALISAEPKRIATLSDEPVLPEFEFGDQSEDIASSGIDRLDAEPVPSELEEFDLRKAIIYTEIINPKYI
jgi:hypothetical protein